MDIYQAVTDRIIAQLDQGIIPWHKPWIASSSAQSISHVTGKPYSLLNQMILGRPGEYLTFKQCQSEGGKIRNSEKSSMVVFWKFVEQEDEETHEKNKFTSSAIITCSTSIKAKASRPNTQNASNNLRSLTPLLMKSSPVIYRPAA